jgi:hypothetical protein
MRGCASGYETRLAAWRADSRPAAVSQSANYVAVSAPCGGSLRRRQPSDKVIAPVRAFEHALAVSIAYSGTLPSRVVTLCAYSKTPRYQTKTTFISSLAIGHLSLSNRTTVGASIGLIVCPSGGPPRS